MFQSRYIKYLKSILLSMLGWVVAVTLFAFIRLYGLDGEGLYQLIIPKEYPLWQVILVQGLTMGSALGLVYGFLDYWLDQGVLKRFAYGLVVVFRTLVHLLLFPVMVILAIVVSFYAGGGNPEYLGMVIRQRLFAPSFFLLLTYTGLVSIVFNTFRQMNAMFGPGILYKVMTGRYHQPKEEERIFMFLDLKSSTTYAERLGHMLYSELIQDCFKDLTETVRKHQAEIYQYVGDEAVLTWTIKTGLEKTNCLWAYFSFEETIQKRSQYYFNKYDLVPVFKAGVNIGLVTVAEVGVIKKEIAYHSDVLNTAARIQGQCNPMGKTLLISERLKDSLHHWQGLQYQPVGTVSLKGKLEEISLFCVERKTEVEHPFEFTENF